MLKYCTFLNAIRISNFTQCCNNRAQIFGAKIEIVAIQIFRETEVVQFGENHIRTCALKLFCYFCNLLIFLFFSLSKVHNGFKMTCVMHSGQNLSKIVWLKEFKTNFIKLERNFQHWLATNKTLGNGTFLQQVECGYEFPALIHVWIASAGVLEWFISTSFISGESVLEIPFQFCKSCLKLLQSDYFR